MNAITGLTPNQLRKAADIQEKILELQASLEQLLGGALNAAPVESALAVETPNASGPKKRKFSAKGLANIRAGALKRKMNAKKSQVMNEQPEAKPKRIVSVAARRKMAASQAARRERERAQAKFA